MIAVAIFIIWCLACAVKEAQEDFDLIVDHKPVRHTFSEWIDRAIIVVAGGAFILFTWVLFAGLPVLQWRLLLFIPIGWSAFTIGFRYALNSMRKLDWRYISPSNLYDWLFLKRTWFTMDGYVTTQKHAVIYHDKCYPHGPFYVVAVHRAGTIAYTFEALVLLASLIFCFWQW